MAKVAICAVLVAGNIALSRSTILYEQLQTWLMGIANGRLASALFGCRRALSSFSPHVDCG